MRVITVKENMASFDLQTFINNPGIEQIKKCRKDDLIAIANYFQIPISKQSLKRDIKSIVVSQLLELKILATPGADGGAGVGPGSTADTQPLHSVGESDEVQAAAVTEAEAEAKAALPPFDPFSPASTGSVDGARLRVRLARLQLEAQEKAQARQAEMELRLEVRRLEIEADTRIKLRKLELEATKVAASPVAQTADIQGSDTPSLPRNPPSVAFDVSKCITLVTPFRETEVDSYFNAFERIASSLNWPKDVWSLLLQCKLVGKAQEICSALSLEESLIYETVKSAILRAYELVPEAYRQRFRTYKRNGNQTFVEFAREKSILFDKWCVACKAADYGSLRELVLLEEFKCCVPERVVVYLNEQKVSSLSQAAVMADEFVLTHKSVFSSVRQEKTPVSSSQTQPVRSKTSVQQPRTDRECFYCHKQGHIIADCLALKRKQQQPKSVGLVKSIPDFLVHDSDACDGSFKPFLMRGLISLTGRSERSSDFKRYRCCSIICCF